MRTAWHDCRVIESDRLTAHLLDTYGAGIDGLSPLDTGVYRVRRSDGPDWVARVYGPERAASVVEGDAEILRNLQRAGFPAERCAHELPVSTVDDYSVLMTEFVDGQKASGRARTYAILGALLGRLHARSGATVRPGGAWHHLCPQGTPRDEIAAALEVLIRARSPSSPSQHRAIDALTAEVEQSDDAADLPHAFVHPDFVPANAIVSTDGSLVIIDWAGAGRGPRLWSIGFLLWVAGATDLRLVDLVASRYRRHTRLEPTELDRLSTVLRCRSLMIECWSIGRGHRRPTTVLSGHRHDAELADRIAERARSAFDAPDEPAAST